jgi:hypothetical protein
MSPRAAQTSLVLSTLLVLTAAVVLAIGGPRGTADVLDVAAPLVAGLVSAGRTLRETASALVGLRPILLVALVIAVVRFRARAMESPAGWLLAAMGFGWLGEWYLLDRHWALGTTSFLAGALLVVLRPAPRTAPPPVGGVLEAALGLVLLATFVLGCLWALDVRPDLGWDEIAFVTAARSKLDDVHPEHVLIYPLVRFEAQAVPLFLQTLALRGLEGGVLAVRVASVIAGTAALAVAAVVLRPRLGATVTLWMLAVAPFTPLQLAYSRLGEYVIYSVLHAALAFAMLLRFRDRPTWAAAVGLGVLVGGALYLYQLSWFVPVLVGLIVLGWPACWRTGATRARLAAAALTALLVTAPGFLYLREGLAAVGAQSFDRAVWRPDTAPAHERGTTLLLPPDRRTEDDVKGVAATLRTRGLKALVLPAQGHRLLLVRGTRDRVLPARDELRTAGWVELRQNSLVRYSAWYNLRAVLRHAFYEPIFDLRLIDVPILNPLLAPLLVLGLVEAARRAGAVRWAVAAWLVGAALLPGVAAGVFPRRLILLLPLAYAVTALPLAALTEALRAGPSSMRLAGAVLAVLLFGAVASTNAELYFEHWDWGNGPRNASRLRLLRLLDTLPPDEVVGVGPAVGATPQYVESYRRGVHPDRPARQMLASRTFAPAEIRRLSCRPGVPVTWVLPTAARELGTMHTVAKEFAADVREDGPFTVFRLRAEGTACAPAGAR